MAIRIPTNGAPINSEDIKDAEAPWAEVMIYRLHRDFLATGGDAAMNRLRAYLGWFKERARIEGDLKAKYPVGSSVWLRSGGPELTVEKHGAVVEQDGQSYIDLEVVHHVDGQTVNGSPLVRITMRSSIVATREEANELNVANFENEEQLRVRRNEAYQRAQGKVQPADNVHGVSGVALKAERKDTHAAHAEPEWRKTHPEEPT